MGFKMKNIKQQAVNSFDDDDEDEIVQGSLGYFVKQVSQTTITVHVDEAVKAPSYYRRVVQAISDLSENDQVIFKINSPGGLVNGLVHVLTAMEATNATSVAQIYGECASAASILALMCDVVYVGDNATMMVHFVSHGASGKADDVYRQVMHVRESNERLFRNVYKGFLTDEELEGCLKGTEYWFNSSEILDRLKKRDELRALEAEREEDEAIIEEAIATEEQTEPKQKEQNNVSMLDVVQKYVRSEAQYVDSDSLLDDDECGS